MYPQVKRLNLVVIGDGLEMCLLEENTQKHSPSTGADAGNRTELLILATVTRLPNLEHALVTEAVIKRACDSSRRDVRLCDRVERARRPREGRRARDGGFHVVFPQEKCLGRMRVFVAWVVEAGCRR